MSGSTGFRYQVVSAAEQRRRAADAVRARVQARRSTVLMLRASVEPAAAKQVRETRAKSLDRADMSRLVQIESELAVEEQALLQAHAQSRVDRARDMVSVELQALQVALPSLRFRLSSEEAASRRSTGQPKEADPVDVLAGRVEAVLGIALGLDESIQADLQKLAQVVTDRDAGYAKAQSFLTELETRITGAIRRQRAKERQERQAQELRYEYAVLLDSDSDPGRRARAIVDGLRVDDDLAKVAAALKVLDQHRTREADRRFTLDQAGAVLREMGYSVDLDPSDSGGATVAMASTPDWPHHGLKLVFPEEAPDVHTIPVAFDDTDGRDDLGFDRSSCDQVDKLMDRLGDRGIPTDMTYRNEPGKLAPQRQLRRTAIQKQAKQKQKRLP
ncbi:hypothetical protein OHB24_34460 [Kribbella sp. NBC_00482]|uniref:hypothetical protein n=1 Tax=Kribbella sp. NBC_00482 TaxID=2975968 RepID=UPI002E1891B3